MKLSLNEIRVMQTLSIKKQIFFSSVADKDKKIFRQLHSKGLLERGETFWKLAKNYKTE